MKTIDPALASPISRLAATRRAISGIERLESRIAPAFVATLAGSVATLTGTDAGETLTISNNGSNLLEHDRFVAGDPGFNSALDFDTTIAGDQTLAAGTATSSLIIHLGGGDDFLSFSGSVAPSTVFCGPGNDVVGGGNFVDQIFGGPGHDFIDSNVSNDIVDGGDGNDAFQWDPGDGSDKLDGNAGADTLIFNGSAGAEIYSLFSSDGHLRLTRNLGNIVMDVGTVETVLLSALGGTDSVTVGDVSGTDLRQLTIRVGASGIPDGALDTINVNGTSLDDDIRVRLTEAAIEIAGLSALIRLEGFDVTDGLNVSGELGVDNVFATTAARAKMVVTTEGEFESSAPSAFQFATPASLDAGKNPTAIATGNLFGAGGDFVVVNAKSNSVTIISRSLAEPLQLSTGGKAPRSVVLGDFNEDGRLDIAVTNSGSANVSVLLNNGDGTFAAPALFATGKQPGKMQAADVNGDGFEDLVMITARNQLSILPGTGTGAFGAPTALNTGGVKPVDFLFKDFNDDGVSDIAIAHAGSNNVTILQANADLSFNPTPIRLRVGIGATALAVGDFNGDGKADLAVSHSVSRFVSVLINASLGGGVQFFGQTKVAHLGRHAAAGIAVADLDRDGRDDIVVANSASGSISAFINAGAAVFRAPIRVDLDNTPPRKTSALVVGDFNGDGRPDIAAANAGTGDISVIVSLRG